MSRGVPEDHLALWVVESQQLDLAVTLERAETIIQFPMVSVLSVLCIWIYQSLIKSANAVKELNLGDYHFIRKAI